MNTFEITIQRKSGDSWPVVVEQSGSDTLLPVRNDGVLELDVAALSQQFSPRDYGTMLGMALFRDDVRDAFVRARAESESADHLSVLLFVEAPDLRILRWERLCAPLENHWDFLALDQRVPLSLYLPSVTDRRFPPIGRRDLRALIIVSSPQGLEQYQLDPFDVAGTVASVRTALGEIPSNVLANVQGAAGLPTLDELCDQITTQPYTLLHLVCHGRFIANSGETVLYLAKPDGQVDPVTSTRFIERLTHLRGAHGLPHFTFLATCESASPQAEGVLGGLAQRLVRELGMPAVLAMTERVSIITAEALAQGFYRHLRIRGEVDVALVEASTALAEHHDITVPALYSRLGSRPLFSGTLDRELTLSEIAFGLSRIQPLFQERAPVLLPVLEKQAESLRGDMNVDVSALSKTAKADREHALTEINNESAEVLDISFNALALGQDPPPYDARCPFRGLYTFGFQDQQFFFGRESLIERLRQRLNQSAFLAVLGPSGSGKSSLVLAGLLPVLLRQQPGLQIITMTPGNEPVAQLQANLEKVQANQPFVLVLDQFEELFTLTSSEEKRHVFVEQLLVFIKQQRVVITMRADFWGECAPYRVLKAIMQSHQELVSPMETAELRQAMEQQAAAVGLRFEADLSNTVLDDVQSEPAAMPLLQHALLELWKRRHGRWLRAEEYRAIGGVQRAIAQTADTVYEELPPAEQERVRDIFVRLTKPDEETVAAEERRDTRQRVWLEELVPSGSSAEATRNLIKRLADARLVVTSVNSVTGHEEVEVAHEALIRHWPRLRAWLDEDRDSLRLRSGIREAAREWEMGKRDESLLVHRGARLQDAEALSQQARFAPNALERAYLDACEGLQRKAARQRRNGITAIGVISTLLLLTIIGALVVSVIQAQAQVRAQNQLLVTKNQLLATLPASVTNTNDSGPGSFRDAIKNAIDGGTITFAKVLRNADGTQCGTKCVITLTSGELLINKDLVISGPGAQNLLISAGNSSRVFHITTPSTTQKTIVVISYMSISNGHVTGQDDLAGSGGGLRIGGGTYLALLNSVVSDNTADLRGGAIFSSGTLTVVNCTFLRNTASIPDNSPKSGIFNTGQMQVYNSSFH